MRNRKQSRDAVRYAVVGLGHFAQVAILPAFASARHSRLVALVSDDPQKRRALKRRYDVEVAVDHDQYEDLLRSGAVDAVYIALPNTLHAESTLAAAKAGVHVLCEKPLATSSREAEAMIRACDERDVRLMVAYRLHFDPANLEAVRLARSGDLGEPRLFASTFSYQVKAPNIRIDREAGGGPIWDIGVYCINAARYLFGDEPIAVTALVARGGGDRRFAEVNEGMSAVLRFPDDRLAHFAVSFGAAAAGWYELVGEKGRLRLDPAFEYDQERILYTTIGKRERQRSFPELDQIAPEIEYFSECIRDRRVPEPSGEEGLADVRIVEALFRAAATGRTVPLVPIDKRVRPTPRQARRKRAHGEPKTVHTRPES
jgi:glucose-fructose oxidoreductase